MEQNMRQKIQQWTKYILWNTTFKKLLGSPLNTLPHIWIEEDSKARIQIISE